VALRICLVEDNPDHVHIIVRAIKGIDAETEIGTFSDGESALEYLRTTTVVPDLVLLDLNMPGISGFDVLGAVKADERLKTIPVVILTSSDLRADVARAYELGASGYITKETYLQDLQAILAHTLLYWQVMKRADPLAQGSVA
jgi:CheY-like chemotaxis protein